MMDALYMTVLRRSPRAILVIVALLVSSSVLGAEAAETFPLPNPAANGKAGDKTPAGWTSFSAEGRYEFAVDTEVFHSAPSSVRIEGFTSTGRACVGVNTGELAPVQSYRLGFWYRTSRECALRGFARFFDCRVGQADDDDNGFTPSGIDFDLDRIGFDTVDCCRQDPG